MSLLNFSVATETKSLLLFQTQLTITDPDNRPIANAAGRFVLGAEAGWREAGKGLRFQTDPHGKAVLKAEGQLREGTRKRPTNFFDSLLSGKEVTDDLQIAVELFYAGEPFLYVVEGHRFRRDGTVLLGQTAVFSGDGQGNFTLIVPRSNDGGWLLPQFRGLAVSTPGNVIAGLLFYPDEKDTSGQTWVLQCQFKQAAVPVQR